MKTIIRIKHNGRWYRTSNSWKCSSKKDCDLFQCGVCDIDGFVEHLPCDKIQKAIRDAGLGSCNRGFKEVTR